MTLQQAAKLIASLILPLVVGAVAGFFTSASIPGWYDALNKPTFSPPNWLFGPVWVTLYLIMGFSCYLVWDAPLSNPRNSALTIYGVQLFLNFVWSFIFFYFKMMGLALIEICLLWVFIVIMIVRFKEIVPSAAYLNVPYLLWVTFASVLNGAFYFLND